MYIHKNKVNGKVYIGITSYEPQKRWANGNGYKNSRRFYNAIKKYGWNGFEHKILYENLSFKKACELEVKLIEDYDSTNKAKGYNIKLGGEIHKQSEETKQILSSIRTGTKMSEETRQKISQSLTGENCYWYGKSRDNEKKSLISKKRKGVKMPDEIKEKISATMQGENCYWYGRHLSDEHKRKISEGNVGKHLTTETKQSISKTLLKRGGTKVDQYSMDGQFLKKWNSISQAAKAVGGDFSHLAKCCKKNKPAYGYVWKYATENETKEIDN